MKYFTFRTYKVKHLTKLANLIGKLAQLSLSVLLFLLLFLLLLLSLLFVPETYGHNQQRYSWDIVAVVFVCFLVFAGRDYFVAVVVVNPRNLPLKFGQKRVWNRWNMVAVVVFVVTAVVVAVILCWVELRMWLSWGFDNFALLLRPWYLIQLKARFDWNWMSNELSSEIWIN